MTKRAQGAERAENCVNKKWSILSWEKEGRQVLPKEKIRRDEFLKDIEPVYGAYEWIPKKGEFCCINNRVAII